MSITRKKTSCIHSVLVARTINKSAQCGSASKNDRYCLNWESLAMFFDYIFHTRSMEERGQLALISIMEKTLEPIGRETDEWVWLRLSDSIYFPGFDTYASSFSWMCVLNYNVNL